MKKIWIVLIVIIVLVASFKGFLLYLEDTCMCGGVSYYININLSDVCNIRIEELSKPIYPKFDFFTVRCCHHGPKAKLVSIVHLNESREIDLVNGTAVLESNCMQNFYDSYHRIPEKVYIDYQGNYVGYFKAN